MLTDDYTIKEMSSFDPLPGFPRYDAWRFANGFEMKERVVREETEEKMEAMEREKIRLRLWASDMEK